MSLLTALNTANGIVLEEAILVVSQISDNSRQDFSYNLPLTGRAETPEAEISFTPNQNNNNNRSAHFQVAVFGSEVLLRAGQPHIALLLDETTKSNNFQITLNDSDTQLNQVYAHLKTLYPDSMTIDLTDIGIN